MDKEIVEPVKCPSSGVLGLKHCDICALKLHRRCVVCNRDFIKTCASWFKCYTCFHTQKKYQDFYNRN